MDKTYASDKQMINALIQNLNWETMTKPAFDAQWNTIKNLVYTFRKKRGTDKTWQSTKS